MIISPQKLLPNLSTDGQENASFGAKNTNPHTAISKPGYYQGSCYVLCCPKDGDILCIFPLAMSYNLKVKKYTFGVSPQLIKMEQLSEQIVAPCAIHSSAIFRVMIYDGEREAEANLLRRHTTTCRQFRKSLFAARRRRRNKLPFRPFSLPRSSRPHRIHGIRTELIAARISGTAEKIICSFFACADAAVTHALLLLAVPSLHYCTRTCTKQGGPIRGQN